MLSREMVRGHGIAKFCDMKCRHAEFPGEEAVDGSRSCRTFAALYCRKKKTYVHKNAPCRDKAPRKAISAVRRGSGSSP